MEWRLEMFEFVKRGDKLGFFLARILGKKEKFPCSNFMWIEGKLYSVKVRIWCGRYYYFERRVLTQEPKYGGKTPPP